MTTTNIEPADDGERQIATWGDGPMCQGSQPAGSPSARWCQRGLVFAAVVTAPVLAPEMGVSQNFFGFFSDHQRAPAHRVDRRDNDGRFGGDGRYAPERSREPYAYADPAEVPREFGSGAPAAAPRVDYAPPSTYCVRLCDGRFFPVTGPAANSRASAAKTCSALCPASKTAIYRGGKIDGATAQNGDRYADLDTAFVYRTKLVDGCTCNGKDALGLARLDIATDPTLRPGDVVATADGLKVFRGGKGGDKSEPHRSADFTSVEDAKKLSADLRRHLATTRVLPAR